MHGTHIWVWKLLILVLYTVSSFAALVVNVQTNQVATYTHDSEIIHLCKQ